MKYNHLMLTKIVKTVSEFIENKRLIAPEENILLAISGGADSICLLYLIYKLKVNGIIKNNFCVAHVNHNLRGKDAERDQEYVRDICSKLVLPFHFASVDVKRYAKEKALSEETAARDLRQQKLSEIATANNCSKIATAHHMNDNAETMIHRLSRGTGFSGLAGIWPVKYFEQLGITYIRPLLCVKRDEIIEYLKSNNIKWQHDYTNDSIDYTRNKIRHIVLPSLQKNSQTDLTEALWELSDKSQKLEAVVIDEVEKLKDSITLKDSAASIDLHLFNKQPQLVKFAIIKEMLENIGFAFHRLTSVHINNIIKLALKEKTNSSLELPLSFTASNEYGKLYITKKTSEKELEKIELNIPGKTEFDGWTINTAIRNAKEIDLKDFIKNKSPFTEWFDMDKLTSEIFVRKRKTADRFTPLGLSASKKVGRFLIDSQTPGVARQRVILFEDSQSIIWLAPLRSSDTTKVNSNTTSILEISISGTNSKFF